MALLVEPLGEGAREGQGMGLVIAARLGGDGDGEVVNRDVLLGFGRYGDLDSSR